MRSLDRASRTVWTGKGVDGKGRGFDPFDLHNFKNGRNVSVADYLNIESKWSPFLSADAKRLKKFSMNDLIADSERIPESFSERWRNQFLGRGKQMPSSDPKTFSTESLLHPFKDKTTIGEFWFFSPIGFMKMAPLPK